MSEICGSQNMGPGPAAASLGGLLEMQILGLALSNLQSQNFFFFFLFRAAPAACGGFQARGQTGAAAAGLRHNHARSELHLCRILNPRSKARDRTCILTDASRIHHR